MPLDASIYSQIQQPQAVNPLSQLAQVSQIQGAQQQNRLAALQMQEYERARQQDEARRLAIQGAGADPTKIGPALLGVGDLAGYNANQKSMAETGKLANEAEASRFKTAYAKSQAYLDIVGSARDQASYDQARQQVAALGVDVANVPPTYSPDYVENARRQAQTEQQRIEAAAKSRGLDIQALTQQEQGRHNRSTESVAQGQLGVAQGNLGVARANLGLRQQELSTGRLPPGYRPGGNGTLEFIPGGPADPQNKAGGGKPLTEGQSKSLVFASRMQEANDTLDKLSGGGTVNSIPGSTLPVVGAAINAIGGQGNQQLVQAKRDFINAVLRRESGAAIASSEFDNADKQYFPQIGDTSAVIAQKRKNREIATRGIAADVPDSENRISQVRGSPAAASGGWSVKEVR